MPATASETKEMLEWYRQSPDAIKAGKKRAEAARNRRVELIARIDSANATAEQSMPGLLAARDVAAKSQSELQTQLTKAVADLHSANQAISALSQSTSEVVGEAECELLRTTPRLVAETIDAVERARTRPQIVADVACIHNGRPVVASAVAEYLGSDNRSGYIIKNLRFAEGRGMLECCEIPTSTGKRSAFAWSPTSHSFFDRMRSVGGIR